MDVAPGVWAAVPGGAVPDQQARNRFRDRKVPGQRADQGRGAGDGEADGDRFGLETLDIIEAEPGKLRQVEGIGEKRIAMIRRAWEEQREIRRVMLFLQEKGVSATYAVKYLQDLRRRLHRGRGGEPLPARAGHLGIGFKTADKIAQQLGIPPDSERRLEAGMVYTLSQATDHGHLYLPEPKLLTAAAEILVVDVDMLPPVLETMISSEAVKAEELPEIEMAGRPMRVVYHPALYYTEIGLAGLVRRHLAQFPIELSPGLRSPNGWQSRSRRTA